MPGAPPTGTVEVPLQASWFEISDRWRRINQACWDGFDVDADGVAGGRLTDPMAALVADDLIKRLGAENENRDPVEGDHGSRLSSLVEPIAVYSKAGVVTAVLVDSYCYLVEGWGGGFWPAQGDPMPTATRNVRPSTSTSKGTQPTRVTKKPPGNASHPDPPHGPPWNGKGVMVSPPTLLPHHAAARCLQPAAGMIVNFTPGRINKPVFAKRRRLPWPDAVWSAYRDEVLVGSATSPASCS